MTPPVSATRRRPARQAGISLIESMVALVIAAVLLGLAVPSMLELIARKRLAAVATELASDLRYLTSVGMKDTRQTNLDVGATCYVLVIDTLGSGAACDCTKPLPCGTSTFGRVVLKRLVIPDSTGITLTSAKAHSTTSAQRSGSGMRSVSACANLPSSPSLFRASTSISRAAALAAMRSPVCENTALASMGLSR